MEQSTGIVISKVEASPVWEAVYEYLQKHGYRKRRDRIKQIKLNHLVEVEHRLREYIR